MHKTEERLRKQGVEQFRLVPPKLALPLLDNATMEDEDDLHSLWAALLATAIDANAREVHRKYITILGDLTSTDAAVLRAIWSDWKALDKMETWGSSTIKYGPGVKGTEAHDEVSVIRLNRLGLIAPNYTEIQTYLPAGYNGDYKTSDHVDSVQLYGDLLVVVVTPLGEACGAVMSN